MGFRLRLFVAKLLGREKVDDTKKIYNTVREIYKARSELVHSGHTEKLNQQMYEQLVEYVKNSLNLYLRASSLFDDLEQMLLN